MKTNSMTRSYAKLSTQALGILLLGSAVLVTSCKGDKESEDVIIQESPSASKKIEVSSETVHEIIQSIPSPIEITSLIKESGAPYNHLLLNPSNNAESYTTENQKALNLGIYGADLGYINIYEKTYSAMEYLDVIRTLSDELKIGQFFAFNTIKRLASNKSNIDSIIYISTSSFENMNNFLTIHKRDNVSTMMLVGGWLESMQIACKIADKTNNQQIVTMVGEQKMSVDQISVLINLFQGNKEFKFIQDKFAELKNIYAGVKVNFEYKEPEAKEVDGKLVFEDNSTTKVDISIEQYRKIADKIDEIRSAVTK